MSVQAENVPVPAGPSEDEVAPQIANEQDDIHSQEANQGDSKS